MKINKPINTPNVERSNSENSSTSSIDRETELFRTLSHSSRASPRNLAASHHLAYIEPNPPYEEEPFSFEKEIPSRQQREVPSQASKSSLNYLSLNEYRDEPHPPNHQMPSQASKSSLNYLSLNEYRDEPHPSNHQMPSQASKSSLKYLSRNQYRRKTHVYDDPIPLHLRTPNPEDQPIPPSRPSLQHYEVPQRSQTPPPVPPRPSLQHYEVPQRSQTPPPAPPRPSLQHYEVPRHNSIDNMLYSDIGLLSQEGHRATGLSNAVSHQSHEYEALEPQYDELLQLEGDTRGVTTQNHTLSPANSQKTPDVATPQQEEETLYDEISEGRKSVLDRIASSAGRAFRPLMDLFKRPSSSTSIDLLRRFSDASPTPPPLPPRNSSRSLGFSPLSGPRLSDNNTQSPFMTLDEEDEEVPDSEIGRLSE